jgi:hypothetical protein
MNISLSLQANTRQAKRKREEDRENKEKNKNALDNYFKKNPITKAPKAKVCATSSAPQSALY